MLETTETLKDLLDERDHLLQNLAKAGDMRPGTISENYRKCGKPTCRCAKPGDPGHGPYYVLTRKVKNKTRTTNLRPGPALVKIQKEVKTYQHFRKTCQRLFEVNEKICDLRPYEEIPPLDGTVKKKRSRSSIKKSSEKSRI